MYVTTLNVRGMSDRTKRQRLFTLFKIRCKGIIFLQETFSLPGDQKVWETEWEGKVFMSHGTRHSCGVAILIPKNYECDITDVTLSENGRHIVLRGHFNGNKLTLLNYYAPTADKTTEQQQQLEHILPIIHNNFSEIIWGGDMNMTLIPELDKYRNTENMTKYATKITQILQEYDLCDIWRLMHPDRKRYTWRRSTPK
jgi:exonuclease III